MDLDAPPMKPAPPRKSSIKKPVRVSVAERARIAELFTRWEALEPNPATELNYRSPYTLVTAVALSAQATDVGVNKATEKLFAEADTPQAMLDLGEARLRIGHFIDHYNFQRPHQGIDNAVPADRYFQAAPQVRAAMRERVAANALELARNGVPKAPFYVTGNVAGQEFSVHAEGEHVILQKGDQRAAISLDPRPEPVVPPPAAPPAEVAVTPPVPAAAPPPISPPVPVPTPVSPAAPAAPVAPVVPPVSGWTGAESQPPGRSAIDRIQRMLAQLPPAAFAGVASLSEEADL